MLLVVTRLMGFLHFGYVYYIACSTGVVCYFFLLLTQLYLFISFLSLVVCTLAWYATPTRCSVSQLLTYCIHTPMKLMTFTPSLSQTLDRPGMILLLCRKCRGGDGNQVCTYQRPQLTRFSGLRPARNNNEIAGKRPPCLLYIMDECRHVVAIPPFF